MKEKKKKNKKKNKKNKKKKKNKNKNKKIYVVYLLVWIINKMPYSHIKEEDGNIGGAQCDLSTRTAHL